jgi:hypothetical protein
MSQAEKPNTTNPSRRALLAGAPAVAAAALAGGIVTNALAIAEAKAAEVDPIFALIELHQKAIDLEAKAHDHFKAMDRLYPRDTEPEEFWTEWSIEQRTAYRDAEIARCKR